MYLSIHGLRKGPGKFLVEVLESPGKVLDFVVSKRVGTLKILRFRLIIHQIHLAPGS